MEMRHRLDNDGTVANEAIPASHADLPPTKAHAAYTYNPLPKDCIRLLRLMPHQDKTAPIQCTLFDYPLIDLDDDDEYHPYDALSYCWGSPEKSRSISLSNHELLITQNLHAALSRLRYRFIERVIWADAICINQEDLKERAQQVQAMARIYAMSNRVIVWLGEEEDDSEHALEQIHRAADSGQKNEDERALRAIFALLQRPWFKRIWVLQEVAAAQNVLIICGSAKLDGFVFCSGLSSHALSYRDQPGLENLIRTATYLIQRTVFRPKSAPNKLSNFLLSIRPLAELIDMYYIREATDPRDKVYALLGMSSDNHGTNILSADYEILWGAFLQKIVRHILSDQLSVRAWDNEDVAVIRGRACVIGQVTRVEPDKSRSDKQKITIESTGAWDYITLQILARSIQSDDFVFLLRGAPKPMIARAHDGYFSVIASAIEIPLTSRLQGPLRSATGFSHDLLFVWNWGKHQTKEKYQQLLDSRAPKDVAANEGYRFDMTGWLRSMGLMLMEAGTYDKAARNFGMRIKNMVAKLSFGARHAQVKLAANKVMEGHERKLRERASWQRMPKQRMADVLMVVGDILGREGDYERISEMVVVKTAKDYDSDVLEVLLHRCWDEIEITQGVVEAAAGNNSTGLQMLQFLSSHRSHQFKITEDVIEAAIEQSGIDILKYLFGVHGEIRITENFLKALLRNERTRSQTFTYLLDQQKSKVDLTDAMVEVLVEDVWCVLEVMRRVFSQQDDKINVTKEGVLRMAGVMTGNGRQIQYLLHDITGTTKETIVRIAETFDEEAVRLPLRDQKFAKHITKDLIDELTENLRCGGKALAMLREIYLLNNRDTEPWPRV